MTGNFVLGYRNSFINVNVDPRTVDDP